MPLIWLPLEIRRACTRDADRYFPLESGGVFMGYSTGEDLVITAMILGGKSALRTRTSYEPDLDWQNRQIAAHYEASGRRDAYLGDWHSHPNTKIAYMSGDDRAVMRRIIRSPEARNSAPVMMIFAGVPKAWKEAAWQGRITKRRYWISTLITTSACVRIFE
jgi:integrative and conjugative element protein (TIGR02256 family)